MLRTRILKIIHLKISHPRSHKIPLGVVESARRWLHSQKNRRQKEALERAVEEQRQILIEEHNKNKNQDAFPLGNTSEGDLKHNATFQSLTNQKHHLSLIISSGVIVVHYLETRKMTMRNMSRAALLIRMLSLMATATRRDRTSKV